MSLRSRVYIAYHAVSDIMIWVSTFVFLDCLSICEFAMFQFTPVGWKLCQDYCFHRGSCKTACYYTQSLRCVLKTEQTMKTFLKRYTRVTNQCGSGREIRLKGPRSNQHSKLQTQADSCPEDTLLLPTRSGTHTCAYVGEACCAAPQRKRSSFVYKQGGRIAEYTCDYEYRMNGPNVITCKDGSWFHLPGICYKIVYDYEALQKTRKRFPGDVLRENLIAFLKVPWGYASGSSCMFQCLRNKSDRFRIQIRNSRELFVQVMLSTSNIGNSRIQLCCIRWEHITNDACTSVEIDASVRLMITISFKGHDVVMQSNGRSVRCHTDLTLSHAQFVTIHGDAYFDKVVLI